MSAEREAGAVDARARAGRGAFMARVAAAHFLCYPMLFWTAIAGMSVPILLREQALLSAAEQTEPIGTFQRWLVAEVGLAAPDAASFDVVMMPLGVVLVLLFVVVHAASLPWARGAMKSAAQGDPSHERRGRRIWLSASLGVAGLVTLAGAVGWARILLW